MARKKTARKTTTAPGKKRNRRSSSEVIADLERRLAAAKTRETEREAKKDPVVKDVIVACRHLLRAQVQASDDTRSKIDPIMVQLCGYIEALGLTVPDALPVKGAAKVA